MNKETPLTAIGDEAIEARIVAWVLGEASAFEIAELERLCEERAELMIFKRRMAAVHGLIAKAEIPQANLSWKLSPTKRQGIEDLLEPLPATAPDRLKEYRVRRSARRTFLSIAACLIFTVIIFGLVAPMTLKMRKKGDVTAARNREMQREFALEEETVVGEYQELKSLRTELPRIEGTLKPRILPGQKTPSTERAMQEAALASEPAELEALAYSRRVETETERKPSPPSSSVSKNSKGSISSGIVIPVPAIPVADPSLNFGDGDDFGKGWGGAGAEAAGGFGGPMKKMLEQREIDGDIDLYTGSTAVSSGVLADVHEGGLKRDLSALAESNKPTDYWDTSKAKGQKVHGEIHTGYTSEYLFRGVDLGANKQPSAEVTNDSLPQITTRSLFSADEALAQAQQLRKVGKYEEARNTLEGALATAPNDPKLGNELAYLDDPIRTSPALTYEHKQDVDKVRRDLISAEGNYKLGKYDDAKRGYEDALRKDPYNTAARKGMENLAKARSDYYSAAYDDTRAELLAEVDKSWEREGRGEGKESNPAAGEKSEMVVNGEVKDKETDGFKQSERHAWWVGDESKKAADDIIDSSGSPTFTGTWNSFDTTSSPPAGLDGFVNYGSPIMGGEGKGHEVLSDHIIGFTGTTDDDELAKKPALGPSSGLASESTAFPVTPSSPAAFDSIPLVGRLFQGDNQPEQQNPSRLAQQEMTRRQNSVAEAERLIIDAKSSQSESDLKAAHENYEKALSLMPDVPSNPTLSARRDLVKQSLAEVSTALENQQAKIDVIREFRYPKEGEASASSDALAKAIREQEDKVEERRKVLSTIVRTKGINFKWEDSSEDQAARSALQTYQALEQQKLQLESQIGSLQKYDSEQLMVYASGLDLPDNVVRQLYPQYLKAKRDMESLKAKGLGDDHPTITSMNDQVGQMKRQLDESAANLEATLKAQLDLASNRLKNVERMKDESREKLVREGLDTQDYVDAKREFETEMALLDAMKSKLAEVKMPKPKPDLTKLIEEIAAAEEPYSTFSLNISDTSFRIAQAAMAKGERPDPTGVKVEQFYNAVNYGDPSPGAGEPVACFIEQSAHPVIPGRNLVRVALKTAAAGRSAAQPLRLTLLVDQSGSMSRADRRAAMDTAMRGLGTLLTDNDLVTVIGFSRKSRLLAVDMKGGEVGEKLADLVNQSASEGGTNLEEAILLAEQKALRQKLVGAQNRIVLFTDGAANLGDADPERLSAKVEQLRQQGIAFDIAGIAADDLNDELLAELARKGNGRYSVVGKGEDQNFAKQLAGAFRPAAENVKVQVRFNPERVARYKLIGFEKDRLKTEDFRNDAVDAAELAAEEAGVAIYQVETLPEGRGEIGEVSVRFRDTARGEMVERMWTMAHDPATPSVDRAAPSMQLAVLAMLAGDKLKGGPLADAIDFKQLAEPQAIVKQAFGQDPRIMEMLQIVDLLK